MQRPGSVYIPLMQKGFGLLENVFTYSFDFVVWAGVAQLVERQPGLRDETHNLESRGPRSRGFEPRSRHQY